ncbi:RNA-directed RNA polymerase [ssRNA phage SRR7976299_16]|uniref:RNA-directed RNA polymerase n=1 Tax=ssRNA phage SRR7976299_16 TaxID=2786638 RepID=A0A8S5L5C1_9VIRU|nr:RNA-directed RNA polymerase [ssRNA phage SRR7976299_16]DAD52660.1 TPA_asm: RNA-directed RNA polymerase [ssRNA phage SRR7976299_16]
MSTRALFRIRKFDSVSRVQSSKKYWTILRQLCLAHSKYEFTHDILRLIRSKDVKGLITYADSLSEQLYSEATRHFVANQFSLLIKKYPHRDSGFDPEAKAVEKFLKAERKCQLMNRKFGLLDTLRSPNEDSFARMRNFVRYVLSDTPDFASVLRETGFGPGASLGVHGNATNLGRKFLSKVWTMTPGAATLGATSFVNNPHILELLSEKRGSLGIFCFDQEAAEREFYKKAQLVTHNKIVFVPKTAKVHRTIAVEPLINGFLQKGVDIVLRRKLKRIGINLSDQSLNQELAYRGSVEAGDPFVTIDLSSASDSISIGLVKNLLPPDWFELLNSLRSANFTMDGKTFSRYHKFCSMGNGFCFPLETLLFVAACNAAECGVPGVDFSVYGDDIIVRQSKSAKVLSILKDMGFSVNTEKTFLQGPFRESCGADWFGGEDVRPFTLDFELDSLTSMFKFLNLTSGKERLATFFEPVRDIVMSWIPRELQFMRPFPGNADSAITVVLDQFLSCDHARWNKTLRAWSWKEMQTQAIRDVKLVGAGGYPTVLVIGALTGSSSHMPFALRRKTRAKVRRVSHSGATSQWLPALQHR